MTNRSHRRLHISTTCFWLDPTSTLRKACFPPTTPSYYILGLAAKVYGNSKLNGRTENLLSYYTSMRSYIAFTSLATSRIHRISRPNSIKKPRQSIPLTSLIREARKSVVVFIQYMPETPSQLVHTFYPIQTSKLKATISPYSRISFAELKDVLKN